jgi:hypothetical protein
VKYIVTDNILINLSFREFNRANGRHVMHPEDILPVAKEYQRYKELKKILKDYRTSSTSAS